MLSAHSPVSPAPVPLAESAHVAGSAPQVDPIRADLEADLGRVAAERDRHASDKLELVAKASSLSKELDAARGRAAAAESERDGLRAELNAIRSERERLAAQFARAGAEAETLRERLAAKTPDPLLVLADYAREKTRAGVAWTRAKIPAEHPALPWFDRAIGAIETTAGVTSAILRDVTLWLAPRLREAYHKAKPHALALYEKAKPRAQELYAKAKSEIETRTAKKG